MPKKQHPARLLRAARYALFFLGCPGCAVLADIGGPKEDAKAVVGSGSKGPEAPAGTSQGGGGAPSPNTCLAQLDSDLHNCGFCGHDCGGAECKQALCVPAAVVSASQVGTLVVDDDRIFFTTASDVQRCLVGTQVMCASLASPAVVAAAAQSGGGGGGGGPNPMPAPRALAPRALALYGDRFFVAEQANGIVFACPKSGCTPSVIGAVRPRSTPSFAGGLAVDSSSVVWGDRDGLGAGSFPQAGARESGSLLDELQPRDVTRVDMLRSGAAFEDVVFRSAEGVFVLPADQDAPIGELLRGASVGDFALDPRFLYAATNGAVIRVDRATKAKVTLLELAGASIAHVVADGKGVYATVRNGGVERLVRVREGAVDTLVIGSELGAIGLSAQWVYFANKSGIARVAR